MNRKKRTLFDKNVTTLSWLKNVTTISLLKNVTTLSSPASSASLIKRVIVPIGQEEQTKREEYGEKKMLAHYLAGLIEGDGYISITNTNRVLFGITFHIKDKPLAEKLLLLIGKGTILRRKSNCVELRFSALKTLNQLVYLLNGKFRTPQIDQLHKLIDWLNKNHSTNIIKLPIDQSNILDNPWWTGFIDAHGGFYIRHSVGSILCKFALEQRMIFPKTNENLNIILNSICNKLDVKLNIRTRKADRYKTTTKSYYLIRVDHQKSIRKLINYLEEYPLLTSKRMDYLDWSSAFDIILNKNHFSVKGSEKILEYKKSMNNKRTYFNWDHLEQLCRLS